MTSYYSKIGLSSNSHPAKSMKGGSKYVKESEVSFEETLELQDTSLCNMSTQQTVSNLQSPTPKQLLRATYEPELTESPKHIRGRLQKDVEHIKKKQILYSKITKKRLRKLQEANVKYLLSQYRETIDEGQVTEQTSARREESERGSFTDKMGLSFLTVCERLRVLRTEVDLLQERVSSTDIQLLREEMRQESDIMKIEDAKCSSCVIL